MKILHVSYHNGCIGDINYVASKLGIGVEVLKADWDYLINHDRAKSIWDKYADYFKNFDVIITSDTAPLSRIFLQNGYKGKLIVWICNRFDYPNRDGFPDVEYFNLWKNNLNNEKVKFISYTPFEYVYARQRGIPLSDFVIKPVAGFIDKNTSTGIPGTVVKEKSFFIPPYHNDTIYMNLHDKCSSLGINTHAGRYHGIQDLVGFKGIIHIPYAWSNLALFEAVKLGIPHLIPSKDFLIKLSTSSNFFWSPPFQREYIEYSEWYCKELKDLFVFFNSWEDLQSISKGYDFSGIIERRLNFIKSHEEGELTKWRDVLNI
jgi:hypothetical protein